MGSRLASRLLFGALLFGCVLCSAVAAAGPRPARTPIHARSTIEGTWAHNYVLVFESPAKWPGLVVSESDAPAVAAIEAKQISDFFAHGLDPEVPALMAQIDGLPLVRGERRTRVLVDPADGKLPYRPQVLKAMSGPQPPDKLDNPEERPAPERCLTGVGQPPLVSLTFATPLQIVRTKDAVALHTEYGDEVRIVPITDKHGPKSAFSRMGDSIGRWEGDTLVVETTNFTPLEVAAPDGNPAADMRVVERFTRLSPTEILYAYSVTNPARYTQTWRAEALLHATRGPIYEYACHEGNYGLVNMLAGARRLEGRVVDGAVSP